MILAQKELRKIASTKQALILSRFFKTGPGEYGEGDLFLGVKVPQVRLIAQKYKNCSDHENKILFESPYHEDRLLGVLILLEKYKLSPTIEKKKKYLNYYLKHKAGLNNWDLIDVSAPKILGGYCFLKKETNKLEKLLISKRHWDRRMAILSTFAFIRQKQTDLTFEFAKKLLNDQEDLMHKATGWMLREAGKRDFEALKQFLKLYGTRMPRTMLRYSIEKFEEKERLKILKETKLKEK